VAEVDCTVDGAPVATTDAMSGVAATTCASISGPAYGFAIGTNTFSSSADDVAGNHADGLDELRRPRDRRRPLHAHDPLRPELGGL
jgi:hypothetical protein